MRDIATKFIFVFDCYSDMNIFYQIREFVRTSYSDFALYFMTSLPDEYTATDYMVYLKRKYAKYLNMNYSDFKIDELKVNTRSLGLGIREVEVIIKRRNEMKKIYIDYDSYLKETLSGPLVPPSLLDDIWHDYSNNVAKNSGRYPYSFKDTLNGGYMKKAPLTFKLYRGVERASQRYKTICHWEDGVKTIIYRDKPINGGPIARAFAWCYVKRTFRTVSHFKKHVDKRTTKIGGVIYFEGNCLQDDYAQASVGQDWILYDIYDAAALAITAKRYGGLKNLNDNYILKAVNIDADLREKIVETSVASINKSLSLTEALENLDKEKKKKTKKSNK